MGWTSLKNIASVAAAPFTGGASLLAADIPGKGSVLGELTGQNSAERANKKNIELQNYWNEKTIELSNNAHQREMADLKAAGLNPILAANSGASVPALGGATVENTMPGGILGKLSEGTAILQGLANAKNLGVNSALQTAQTANTNAQTAQTQLNTAITKKLKPSTIAQAEQNVTNAIETQKLIQAQTAESAAKFNETNAQTDKLIEETKKIKGGKLSDIAGTDVWDGPNLKQKTAYINRDYLTKLH